jgi:hypothetical protein
MYFFSKMLQNMVFLKFVFEIWYKIWLEIYIMLFNLCFFDKMLYNNFFCKTLTETQYFILILIKKYFNIEHCSRTFFLLII